jgi:hypothetical protein
MFENTNTSGNILNGVGVAITSDPSIDGGSTKPELAVEYFSNGNWGGWDKNVIQDGSIAVGNIIPDGSTISIQEASNEVDIFINGVKSFHLLKSLFSGSTVFNTALPYGEVDINSNQAGSPLSAMGNGNFAGANSAKFSNITGGSTLNPIQTDSNYTVIVNGSTVEYGGPGAAKQSAKAFAKTQGSVTSSAADHVIPTTVHYATN